MNSTILIRFSNHILNHSRVPILIFLNGHFNISKWPFAAAIEHTYSFQEQPLSRAHYLLHDNKLIHPKRNHFLVPILIFPSGHFFAAPEHVFIFQIHPIFRAHFNISKYPFFAIVLSIQNYIIYFLIELIE